METISTGKLLFQYLCEKWKSIFFMIIMEVFFLLLCYLYQVVQIRDLFYGVILSGFIGICVLGYGFLDYRKYNQILSDALVNIENIVEALPEPQGIYAKKYTEMIRRLTEERTGLISEADIKEQEMKDYYTLWVHQIKTPIAAMKLLLQSEKDIPLTFSQELFKIEQYAEMALHYTRLESMSYDMILKEYELYDIVKQAVKKYGVLFFNRNLNFRLEEFSKTVITDEKWLCFIIEQLFSNAIKYSDNGKRGAENGITIYLENEKLVIEDTGIGIRSEDLPRIFDKGFTGYNGRMDKKSTGIGLYLCKKILTKLSHTIEVQSELSKGTKVMLDFSVRELN